MDETNETENLTPSDTLPNGAALLAAMAMGRESGALETKHDLENGDIKVLVPPGYSTHTINALNPKLPAFVEHTITHVELASFMAYLNAFKTADTVVQGILGQNKIVGTIDYHKKPDDAGTPTPDRNKFKVSMDAIFDPNWDKWRKVNDKWLSQLDFAYFIEEMMHTIAEPAGADLLDMAQNLKINRNVVFKSNERLATGEQDIQYTTEDDKSKDGHFTIPEDITLMVPIFMMRKPQQVNVKLRYNLSPGEPLKFRFSILNIDLIELEAFKVITDEVVKETKLPVYLTK